MALCGRKIGTIVVVPLLIFASYFAIKCLRELPTCEKANESALSNNQFADSIVTVKFHAASRLGNCMFLYASLLGIALTNRKSPVFVNPPTEFSLFEDAFELTVKSVASLDYNQSKLASVIEESPRRMSDRVKRLPPKTNVSLSGFFCSWRYFQNSFDLIRREFRFRPAVERVCSETVEEILAERGDERQRCLLIGAHMRRGDFVVSAGAKRLPATEQFLNRSIQHMRDRFATSADCIYFLILGGDFAWNRQQAPNATDVIVLKPQTPAVDLCILSSCDHVIVSVGTFGWWGAFLANGYTIYQKDHLVPESLAEFSANDYFMPGWVAV